MRGQAMSRQNRNRTEIPHTGKVTRRGGTAPPARNPMEMTRCLVIHHHKIPPRVTIRPIGIGTIRKFFGVQESIAIPILLCRIRSVNIGFIPVRQAIPVRIDTERIGEEGEFFNIT